MREQATCSDVSQVSEDEVVYRLRTKNCLEAQGKAFRLIDLFAGAGGLAPGSAKRFGHAFDPVWANGFSEYCVETYNANFGEHCLPGDTQDLLVVGLTGCLTRQPYSLIDPDLAIA